MDEKKALKNLEEARERFQKMQIEFSGLHESYDSLKEGSKEKDKQAKQMDKAKKVYSDIKEQYAKSIYEYYSLIKPDLLVRKTKETIQWMDAFSMSFKELSEDQLKSVIALVEEDGGRFRVKKT